MFSARLRLTDEKRMKDMKRTLLTFTLAVSFLLGLSSCSGFISGDDYSLQSYNALVTVKHTESGTLYFQLDDKTTLKPYGMSETAFGKEQFRALIGYTERNEKPAATSDGFQIDKSVNVHHFAKVLTKAIAESQGEKDDELYGTAPVEIVKSWATIIEDGYITLVFCGYWGSLYATHKINLVSGVDSEDPYLLELRHDANGDDLKYGMVRYNSIAAFDLSTLPDTEGKTVKLRIRFTSFTGEKTVSFDYCTGKTSLPDVKASDINLSELADVI